MALPPALLSANVNMVEPETPSCVVGGSHILRRAEKAGPKEPEPLTALENFLSSSYSSTFDFFYMWQEWKFIF